VPTDPTPGRSLVTRRAIVDVIRAATLGSYGVTGFAASLPERVLGFLGIGHPGIRVTLDDAPVVDLDITVAFGLPVAEVARQVDSAVRYGLRRSLGREVGRLTIHVEGLRYQPGGPPPAPVAHADERLAPVQPAESGTDAA
jgi:uncharacterized alkaline shock family protein YloU